MRVPFRKIGIAAAAMFVLGIVYFIVAFLALGGVQSQADSLYGLKSLLAMLSMLLIVLSMALLGGILPILAIAEVLSSQNDNGWKALWVIVLFVFSWIGLLAYLFIGRRELKERGQGA